MYNRIINPLNGIPVNLNSNLGKRILKKYLLALVGGYSSPQKDHETNQALAEAQSVDYSEVLSPTRPQSLKDKMDAAESPVTSRNLVKQMAQAGVNEENETLLPPAQSIGKKSGKTCIDDCKTRFNCQGAMCVKTCKTEDGVEPCELKSKAD